MFISIILVQLNCEDREASENHKMKKKILPTVELEPLTFRLQSEIANYCATDIKHKYKQL